jgi:hypothetical protein
MYRDKINFPWKEVLGFLTAIFTAYIGYLGLRAQAEIPIQATQTAEAKLPNISTVYVPPIQVSTQTPVYTPEVNTSVILATPTALQIVSVATPAEENFTNSPISSGKIGFFWSNWIISFITSMPQSTWIATSIFLGLAFFIISILLFVRTAQSKGNGSISTLRILIFEGLALFGIIFSINTWGWWGILWGLLFMFIITPFMVYRFLFGASVGGISGILIGTSASLFLIIWSGTLSTEPITVGSIIGLIIGMVAGVIFIRGSAVDD